MERRTVQPLPPSLFDADAYLKANPDVLPFVSGGHLTAYQHYSQYGFAEERQGLRPVSLPNQSQKLVMQAYAERSMEERIVDLEVEKRALLTAWDEHFSKINEISFEMLSDEVEDEVAPPLDRKVVDESLLSDDQRFWRDNGYLIKRGFIPTDLIDKYVSVRSRVPNPRGWGCPVPYMHIAEIRDVCLYPPLMALMQSLIGEEMGLHLNLTGWVSTDRNWHQDDYLNPPYINSWYSAVWIALDDIHPDSGPFEFAPGSHKWRLMKSHKVKLYLQPEERERVDWPNIAERFVNAIAAEEIEKRGIVTEKFIAKKGDLLIWHGRLMHRGSYAKVPGMPRRTLIGHYSGLSHRIDLPEVARTEQGQPYFVIPLPLDYDPYADIRETAEPLAAAAV